MKEAGAEAFLRAVPAALAPRLRAVIQAADARELAVYAVGGPVRDFLLARAIADLDLIVEPRAGEDAEALGRAVAEDGMRLRQHDRFGTLSLEASSGVIDLASVRRETYAHPGALPTTEPGTLEEDLRRRDFSVNALALPLSRAARARHRGVIDVEEGLRDLEGKRLRVLHPASFRDDPTRALRAARLAPRLGFALTRDSRAALRDALRLGAFGRVSGERLRREFEKLFADAALGACIAAAPGPGRRCAALAVRALAALGVGARALAGAASASAPPTHARALRGAGRTGRVDLRLREAAGREAARARPRARARRDRCRARRARRGGAARALGCGAAGRAPACGALRGRGSRAPRAARRDRAGGHRSRRT